MTGYITGTLADADGAEELLRTAEQSLRVAEQLDCPRLNVHGTGLDDQGLPVLPREVVTPGDVADRGPDADPAGRAGRAGRPGVHPGEPEHRRRPPRRPRSPRPPTRWRWCEAVDNPHLRMNLDLYHAQIGEGNLIQLARAGAAGGRRDPGRRRARPLRTRHRARSTTRPSPPRWTASATTVSSGLEGWASGDPSPALERFRNAFTVQR